MSLTTALIPQTKPKTNELTLYSGNDCTTIAAPSADYISIATKAIKRGLKVTPVHPMEKRAVLHGWNRHPATTLSEIIQKSRVLS